jgi:molecular chaperone DnaJ
MAAKNYYMILGVSRQESARGIQEAFRSLAKRYHPDRTGPQGTAAFQDIVEAYQVLSDPARRGLYNQGLRHAEGASHVTPEPIAPPFGPAPEPLVPKPVPGLRGVQALHPAFASLGERIRRRVIEEAEWDTPCEGLDVGILLSAQEAMTGGTLAVTIPVYYPCSACRGAGRTWSHVCSSCHGQGFLQEPETLRVSIPSMVQDGTLLEVPVRGLGIHNFYVRLHLRVV